MCMAVELQWYVTESWTGMKQIVVVPLLQAARRAARAEPRRDRVRCSVCARLCQRGPGSAGGRGSDGGAAARGQRPAQQGAAAARATVKRAR